jgi:hypothetical protein
MCSTLEWCWTCITFRLLWDLVRVDALLLIFRVSSAGSTYLAGITISVSPVAGRESVGTVPVALIMDHGLRAESSAEAQQATETAERLGLRTVQLNAQWSHGFPPKGQLLQAARAVRYASMHAKCAELQIPWLLTGHHAGTWACLLVPCMPWADERL